MDLMETRWKRSVFATFACTAAGLAAASYAFFAPFFPLHAQEFRLNEFEIGVVFCAFALAQLACSPFVGMLATRFSRRYVALVGFGFIVSCTYCFGQVPHASQACLIFFILRMGQGIAGSLIMTCVNAALTEAFPDSRGLVMGASELATSFGWSAGPAIGGLLYSAGGFSLPFTTLSALCLISAIPVIGLWPSSSHVDQKSSDETLASGLAVLLGAPGLMPTMLLQVALLTSWCAFDLGFTYWLHESFGFGTLVSSLYFAIGPTVYALVSFPVGWTCDRFKQGKLLMAAGMFGQGLSFALLAPPFDAGPRTVAALMVLNGLSAPVALVPVLPEMLSTLAVENEESVNSMSTLYTTLTAMGSTIGPLIGSRLIELMGPCSELHGCPLHGFQWMMLFFAVVDFLIAAMMMSMNVAKTGSLKEKLLGQEQSSSST